MMTTVYYPYSGNVHAGIDQYISVLMESLVVLIQWHHAIKITTKLHALTKTTDSSTTL